MQRKSLILTIDAAGGCDRGCRCCSSNALPGDKRRFPPEILRMILRQADGLKLPIHDLCLTGGGDPTYNPNLPELVAMAGRNKRVRRISLMTSGFSSGEKQRRDIMEKLVRSPWHNRLYWALSFNLYSPTFPDRLANTLTFLIKNMGKMNWMINIKVVFSPQIAERTFDRLKRVFQGINRISDGSIHVRPAGIFLEGQNTQWLFSFQRAWELKIWSQEDYNLLRCLSFLSDVVFHATSRFGNKALIATTQLLKKYGRAVNLPGARLRDSCFLFSPEERMPVFINLDCEGNAYPSCDCCYDHPELRIGNLGDVSLEEIIRRVRALKENLPRLILGSPAIHPQGLCGICRQVMAEHFRWQ